MSTNSPRRGFQFSLRALLGSIAILAVVLFLVVPPILDHRSHPPDHYQCQSNLKQIALALHNYLSQHGCFPPAYIADASGKPMHSWRVILLPYFERDFGDAPLPDLRELYDQYDFREPWDGPHNRELISRMPEVYRCGRKGAMPPGTTDFVAVVGNETIWPATHGRTVSEVHDGLSSTIMVVETCGLGIDWTEPRDLEFALLDFEIRSTPSYGLGREGAKASVVLFADGSVKTLWLENAPRATLRALLTVDGGENVAPP